MSPEEVTALFDSVLENCNNLRRRAQKAERQNTLLKEKLVDELARYLNPSSTPWEYISEEDKPDSLYPACIRKGKIALRKMARDQLRAEMPEVKW